MYKKRKRGLLARIRDFLFKKKSKSSSESGSAQKEEVNTVINSTSARKAAREGVKAENKSYGPKVDPIIEEGNLALSEMGRLYSSIDDVEIRSKINEIMKVTDKIMQDAIEDPSDIPQIKKFFKYYLPTTIKLLNAYDRMSSQDIDGDNIVRSLDNISEMLDTAIDAYKKRLDSLFANQALDIETDIDVLNQMLAREGLTDNKDFNVQQSFESSLGSAAQAQQVQKG